MTTNEKCLDNLVLPSENVRPSAHARQTNKATGWRVRTSGRCPPGSCQAPAHSRMGAQHQWAAGTAPIGLGADTILENSLVGGMREDKHTRGIQLGP